MSDDQTTAVETTEPTAPKLTSRQKKLIGAAAAAAAAIGLSAYLAKKNNEEDAWNGGDDVEIFDETT